MVVEQLSAVAEGDCPAAEGMGGRSLQDGVAAGVVENRPVSAERVVGIGKDESPGRAGVGGVEQRPRAGESAAQGDVLHAGAAVILDNPASGTDGEGRVHRMMISGGIVIPKTKRATVIECGGGQRPGDVLSAGCTQPGQVHRARAGNPQESLAHCRGMEDGRVVHRAVADTQRTLANENFPGDVVRNIVESQGMVAGFLESLIACESHGDYGQPVPGFDDRSADGGLQGKRTVLRDDVPRVGRHGVAEDEPADDLPAAAEVELAGGGDVDLGEVRHHIGAEHGHVGIAVPIARGIPTAAGIFRPCVSGVVADEQGGAGAASETVAGSRVQGECEAFMNAVRSGCDRHDLQDFCQLALGERKGIGERLEIHTSNSAAGKGE